MLDSSDRFIFEKPGGVSNSYQGVGYNLETD